jgi:23S rRNA (pseudouridine1915-N3)-methyltransferase
MRLVVVAVGRVRGPIVPVVEEYERRAARYWKLDVIEVPAGLKGSASAPPAQVVEAEEARILAKLPHDVEVFALTRVGEAISSDELARRLASAATRSAPGVAFVIGGAFGLGEAVLARAKARLALSSMTLPHEMARAVLAEQLYRAGTIVRGEPYHKGRPTPS